MTCTGERVSGFLVCLQVVRHRVVSGVLPETVGDDSECGWHLTGLATELDL
ncbi:hypothetical protein RISK_005969 [Rhodopirellula islandica]|uniref:Uncharacterized protein n=1 Tax=Rhodopirellula islandica TaxID=595434 RepID=A0A0J1E913_RHOIS|nr:hypothetical protein RISK_005969 [Rhodopirellula islandica]